MITEEEYLEYLGSEAPSDLNVLQDIALSMLLETCPQFPQTPETLNAYEERIVEMLKKVVILQINHLDINRNIVDGEGEGSFTASKYSDSGTSLNFPIGVRALLSATGICNLWVTPNNGCKNCKL